MRKLVDRIEQLEKGNAVWAGCRLIRIKEGEDADAAVEEDRRETRFAGEYVIVVHVKSSRTDSTLRLQ